MFISKLSLALLLIKNVFASSCVGYKFVVKNAKNCNDEDQVIKLINSSIEINDDCETFSRTCSEIKPYKNAMVETTVLKGQFPIFKKKTDFCDPKAKKSEMMQVGLAIFGIPPTCSYNATPIFCFENKKIVTFSESTMRLLHAFPVFGSGTVSKIFITHDTGTSCFETETELIVKT